MLMIEPARLASSSRRATACAAKKAARTLSAKMASKSSTLTSIRSAGRLVPALLTSTSNGSAGAEGAGHRTETGDVELQRVGLAAARADRLRRRFDLRQRARGERDVGAGLRQRR